MPDAALMQCFRIIIHGVFTYRVKLAPEVETARYLALYLQPQGLLDDVFRAFRDRDPGAAANPAAEAVAIVERIAGPMAQLEPAFCNGSLASGRATTTTFRMLSRNPFPVTARKEVLGCGLCNRPDTARSLVRKLGLKLGAN